MPKKAPEQQPQLSPATATQFEGRILRTMNIGPFEVDAHSAIDIDEGVRSYLVSVDAQHGPDAYAIRETVMTAAGEGARAYRTVQRMELATRLQLPADYDPADLVGRTFLVPA
jgi:hypothetical protein